ncbi:unnamed protein product [Rangifer tarandus platyrhynchus]|uniref:Uncharacterized protein n=1 Tax=Rangifer tarandus platyrhynchus TaxID=3082113 RepID=A0ABN8ZV61_RANTA|nr:unnamed protein product [Rangifer tarandus platyrhynchus]
MYISKDSYFDLHQHCLHLEIWEQFTVNLLAVLQTEVPAETIAIHQNTQTGCMVSWKLFGKTKTTQTHTRFMCILFEVTSTGAALISNRIPNDLLLYPQDYRKCELK